MAGHAIGERQIMTESPGQPQPDHQAGPASATKGAQILPSSAKTAKKSPYNLGLVPR
jgi:hypothetical protein